MVHRVRPSRLRRLWLRIKIRVTGFPKPPVDEVWQVLINSIERGDYRYPDNWYVQIEWRNRENVPNRVGEFSAEMSLSKRSSDGFDKAVLNYLRSR